MLCKARQLSKAALGTVASPSGGWPWGLQIKTALSPRCPPVRRAKIGTPGLGRMCGNQNPRTLLVGTDRGAAALENSLAVSKTCKHNTYRVSQPLHAEVFLQGKGKQMPAHKCSEKLKTAPPGEDCRNNLRSAQTGGYYYSARRGMSHPYQASAGRYLRVVVPGERSQAPNTYVHIYIVHHSLYVKSSGKRQSHLYGRCTHQRLPGTGCGQRGEGIRNLGWTCSLS